MGNLNCRPSCTVDTSCQMSRDVAGPAQRQHAETQSHSPELVSLFHWFMSLQTQYAWSHAAICRPDPLILVVLGVYRVSVNWASTKAGWRRRRMLLQRLARLPAAALLWVASCLATCAPPLPPRPCRRCGATSRLPCALCKPDAPLLILLMLSESRRRRGCFNRRVHSVQRGAGYLK